MNYYKAYFLLAVFMVIGISLMATFSVISSSLKSMNSPEGEVPQDSLNLRDYQWKKRIILLFADPNPYTEFNKQQAMLTKAVKELQEREVIVFCFFEKVYVAPLGESFFGGINKAYRKHFRVAPEGFQILLIGKDGGVKLKEDTLVNVQTIIELIDSMPMRQSEKQ